MRNLPEPGKVFEITQSFYTTAGVLYEKGDTLELIKSTEESPFGFESHFCNWVVKCKHWSPPDPHSIWSSIWYMIGRGLIQEKENVDAIQDSSGETNEN